MKEWVKADSAKAKRQAKLLGIWAKYQSTKPESFAALSAEPLALSQVNSAAHVLCSFPSTRVRRLPGLAGGMGRIPQLGRAQGETWEAPRDTGLASGFLSEPTAFIKNSNFAPIASRE